MFSPHDIVRNESAVLEKGQVSPATREVGPNWVSYGKTGEGTRYAPFDQINRDNVDQLEVAWIARTGFIADQSKNLQGQNTPRMSTAHSTTAPPLYR